MWQGFPLLVVGTTDKSKQFHPFGVMISKNEDNHDFEFMFDQLKKLLKAVHNFDYKPTVLIADAAEASAKKGLV